MKTLQDWANEIAEAHWNRPRPGFEIFKSQLIAFRKCTPEENKHWSKYTKQELEKMPKDKLGKLVEDMFDEQSGI